VGQGRKLRWSRGSIESTSSGARRVRGVGELHPNVSKL
jgi:hypothetical protein